MPKTKNSLRNFLYGWFPLFIFTKINMEDFKMSEETKYELVKFIDNELELEVSVSPKEEKIWMTQTEIAELFGKDRKTITRHIQNILKEFELKETQVCSKNEHTALDGKKYIVKIYNLDMIIAIGYRVKSKRAIIFRQWANKVLKEYLLKGYVINENRVTVSNENYIELRNEVTSINNRLLEVIYTTKVHDRYIIIDQNKLYHLGHSIKDLGNKIFSISELDSKFIRVLISNL